MHPLYLWIMDSAKMQTRSWDKDPTLQLPSWLIKAIMCSLATIEEPDIAECTSNMTQSKMETNSSTTASTNLVSMISQPWLTSLDTLHTRRESHTLDTLKEQPKCSQLFLSTTGIWTKRSMYLLHWLQLHHSNVRNLLILKKNKLVYIMWWRRSKKRQENMVFMKLARPCILWRRLLQCLSHSCQQQIGIMQDMSQDQSNQCSISFNLKLLILLDNSITEEKKIWRDITPSIHQDSKLSISRCQLVCMLEKKTWLQVQMTQNGLSHSWSM